MSDDLHPVEPFCDQMAAWLAARAGGVGVGWVSILNNDDLRRILEIPPWYP